MPACPIKGLLRESGRFVKFADTAIRHSPMAKPRFQWRNPLSPRREL
jgi:hypothetical protein